MTKREALILTLAGSLATSGVGRYEEHYARAERLVDEVLAEGAHELADVVRSMDRGVVRMSGRRVTDVALIADLIDPEVS